MRAHVALTPAEFPALALRDAAAIVVDVLRATTTVVAACAAGCLRVIPAADPDAARARAGRLPPGEVLLAGEQGGEPIVGFPLGNSPLECTAERVGGRTLVLTTTNGAGAMLAAAAARASAVAALSNVAAAARWAAEQERDLTVLCAGEQGAFSLEDAVCAGLLVARLAEVAPGLEMTDAAVAAARLGEHYATRLDRLAQESRWAQHLTRTGRGADVAACLRLGTLRLVPCFENGVVLPAASALTALVAATHTEVEPRIGPEPTR